MPTSCVFPEKATGSGFQEDNLLADLVIL